MMSLDETLVNALKRAHLDSAIRLTSGLPNQVQILRRLWQLRCQGKRVTVIGSKIFIESVKYLPSEIF